MAAGVVVVVIIAASESSSPASDAMLTAARDALGEGALVLVHPQAMPVSDDAASNIGEKVSAGAVVTVTWPSDHTSAKLHVRVVREKRWVDRDLTFGAGDALAERGRAVGLEIASVVATEAKPAEPVPPPVVTEPPSAPPRVEAPAPRPTVRASSGPLLDAAFASILGGNAGAFGGVFRPGFELAELARVRAVLGIGFGSISAASASSSTIRLGAGAGIVALRAGAWTGAVHIDALALRHGASRVAPDGSLEQQHRWIGAVGTLVDLDWRTSRHVGMFLDAGVELALGSTRVIVGDEVVGTIPRLRAVLDLGVRVRL